MANERWLPLESNPDVLNKYIERLGVTNGKFLDIISLDNDYLSYITEKIVAIVILFPLKEGIPTPNEKFDVDMKNIYFCDQIIHNACGTLAVIHAVLNNVDVINLDPDSPLELFYRETIYMTPKERGKFLLDFEPIKESHTDSALEGQTSTPSLDEQLDLHFVTIVGKNNHLYELDGRKEYPIVRCPLEDKNKFFQRAIGVCRDKMENDPSELRFNVMALAQTQ